MATPTSTIGTAQQMSLTVASVLRQTSERMREYLRHLQDVKERLEAQLRHSHGADVPAMLAVVQRAIDALVRAIGQVVDGANRAVQIEARL